MSLPTWRKALGRAPSLTPRELVGLGLRRARATLRGRAEEVRARLLHLREGSENLPSVVPGAHSVAEAVGLLEASAGAPPVAAANLPDLLRAVDARFPGFSEGLIGRADRACDGVWQILGHPPAHLGRFPDWQRDFVADRRWDPNLASRKQVIARGDGSDIKVPWEMSRLQHLPSVAHAFHLTGDERYLELLRQQLEDWIGRNPPGLGVNWAGAMDVALRAVSIAWAWELCRSQPSLPLHLRAQVYWSLFAHGHFLRGHLEDGGSFVGNHYVANLLGLIWLGHTYPAFKGASEWLETGTHRLVDHLPNQVGADGGGLEGSIAYHCLVAEMIGLAATLTRNSKLATAFVAMGRFTRGILKPDGTIPQLGDNDGGRAFRLVDRPARHGLHLASWASAFDPSLRAPADPEAALLSGTLSDQEPIAGPEIAHLTAFGITALRRDDFYVALSAAPVGQNGGGGHGHNDKLGVELWIGGDVIADPGTFAYTGDPVARNAFRATAAHATAQVDDREQNPIGPDLFHLPEQAHARVLGFEPADGALVWVGEHQGFAPLVHRRTARVDLAQKSVRLTDEIRGPGPYTAREHTLTARLPLSPEVSGRIDGHGFLVGRGGEAILRVSASPEAQLSVDNGWYSPDYGARVPCQVLKVSTRGKLPLRLDLDLLAPQSAPEGG